MTSKKIATVKKLALRFLSKTGIMQMITSAFLERAQSTRNSPKKMCPPSKKSLFTLAVRVRYQKVLCKDWKVSEYCPAGDWCNRWTFCTVVQHTAPGLQILPSSVLPSFAFDGTSFLSMETNGQLLVHWVSRGQGVKSNLHSKFLLLRGLSSHPWKIYAGWWWSQLGDTLTRHQFLLWQSFDKTFTSKLSLCSFAGCTYIFWTMAIEQKASRKKSQGK